MNQQTVNWRSEAASMCEAFHQLLVPILLDGLINRLLSDHVESEKSQLGSGAIIHRLREVICKSIYTCLPRPTILASHTNEVPIVSVSAKGLSSTVDNVTAVPIDWSEN